MMADKRIVFGGQLWVWVSVLVCLVAFSKENGIVIV